MVTYGDGVCECRPRRACCVPPGARQAGHGHRRAPAGPVRRHGASTAGPGGSGSRRSRRSAKAGSTAASWCSSRASSTTSKDDETSLERSTPRALAAEGQLVAYRHDGFWQCMDTLGTCSSWRSLAERARRRGRSGSDDPTLGGPARARHRRHRPRGRLAGQGSARARAPTWSALVLDADPQSELYRSGDIDRVAVVNGALRKTSTRSSARIAGHADRHASSTSAAQTIVETAQRAPWLDLRGQHPRHLQRARGVPASRRPWSGGRGRLSATRPTATTDVLPYTEDMPLRGPPPLRRRRRAAPTCSRSPTQHAYGLPVGIARCGNVYGGGDLHWEPHRAWHHPLALAGRAPDHPQRRHLRPRLPLRRGLRLGIPGAGPTAWTDRTWPGEAFNFSTESWVQVREIVATIQKIMGRTDLEPARAGRRRRGDQEPVAVGAQGARAPRLAAGIRSGAGAQETVAWYTTSSESDRCGARRLAAGPAVIRPWAWCCRLGEMPLANALLTAEQLGARSLASRSTLRAARGAPSCRSPRRCAGDALRRLPVLLVLLRHHGAPRGGPGRAPHPRAAPGAEEPGAGDRQQRWLPAPALRPGRCPGTGR